MTILLFLFTVLIDDIEKSNLEVHPTTNPNFVLDESGHVWLSDYRGDKIWKYGDDGAVVLTIDGSGPGPESIGYPRFIHFFNHEIVVFMKYGLIKVYDSRTGKYKRTISHFFPSSVFGKFGPNRYYSLFGGIPKTTNHPLAKKSLTDNKNNVYIFDLDGEPIHSFFITPPTYDSAQTQLNRDETVYHPRLGFIQADGADPEIQIWPTEGGDASVHRLKPPRHFVPKPPPLAEKDRWDRVKVYDHLESFTQIRHIFLHNNQLWVNWQLYKPYPFALTVFDLDNFSPIHGDIRVPGEIIGIHENQVFIIERKENDSPMGEKWILHKIPIPTLFKEDIH